MGCRSADNLRVAYFGHEQPLSLRNVLKFCYLDLGDFLAKWMLSKLNFKQQNPKGSVKNKLLVLGNIFQFLLEVRP